MRRLSALLLACSPFLACSPRLEKPAAPRPSILLVTLDTTRYDAVGADTPNISAFAKSARRYSQAYCAVPQTLASHGSMMTGLYPAGHGVHENGRYFSDKTPMLAERLKATGYATAAFVSAFAVARRFGLARGFDVYDDEFGPDREQRPANETTDRALAWLAKPSSSPRFVWVHYYDPHFPYTPPEPFASRYAGRPYAGEVAFMDQELGRLLKAWSGAVIIVADHGEGLGDHGEPQHGNLLYQQTMHVPLFVRGPGVAVGDDSIPISTRQVFDMISAWSAGSAPPSVPQVVMAEAMKPFLDYGWQPQVMAIDGRLKIISAGKIEIYNVMVDPEEKHDLAGSVDVSRTVRLALQEYPIPSAAEAAAAPPSATTEEERKKLASLGYVAATTRPIIRKDAPRPADMTALFPILDQASGLFVRGAYAQCIPLFEKVVAADPYNLDAILHLATAYDALGRDKQALDAFARAQAVAPDSPDVRAYLGLHYAHGKDWAKAVPLLERVVADDPSRLPALEGLATVRERQGRVAEAIALWQRVFSMRTPGDAELAHLGALAMSVGDTTAAIAALEKTHGHDLELGVLYLDARRFEDARTALDRVSASHPEYPMALFKRAQVSVLLHEPDAPARIEAARAHATPLTRELIARERLFR